MRRSEGQRAASALQQPPCPSLLEAHQLLLAFELHIELLVCLGVGTPTCGSLGSCIQTQVRCLPFLDTALPPPACLAHSPYLAPSSQL